MNTPPRRAVGFGLIATATHASLWLALGAVLFLVMPLFIRVYRDFNIKLPLHAELTVNASLALAHYPLVGVLAFVLFLALDVVVLIVLLGREDRNALRWAWAIFWVVVPLGFNLLAAFGTADVYFRLRDGLQGTP